jgi:hypothetical protein
MLLSLNKRMSSKLLDERQLTRGRTVSGQRRTSCSWQCGGDVITTRITAEAIAATVQRNGQDIRHLVQWHRCLSNCRNFLRLGSAHRRQLGLSGILRARSGMHLTPVISTDRDMTGQNVIQQRTDLLSDECTGQPMHQRPSSSNPTCRWFNASAFALPAEGAHGYGCVREIPKSGKLDDRSGPCPEPSTSARGDDSSSERKQRML